MSIQQASVFRLTRTGVHIHHLWLSLPPFHHHHRNLRECLPLLHRISRSLISRNWCGDVHRIGPVRRNQRQADSEEKSKRRRVAGDQIGRADTCRHLYPNRPLLVWMVGGETNSLGYAHHRNRMGGPRTAWNIRKLKLYILWRKSC